MSRKFVKNEKIVQRKIRDEYVLVPIMESMQVLNALYRLNDSAALIWEQACAGSTEQEIIDRMVAEFEVDPDDARCDVEKILDELVAVRALQVQ
jgi:hypothetical protein